MAINRKTYTWCKRYDGCIPNEFVEYIKNNFDNQQKMSELGTILKNNIHHDVFNYLVEQTMRPFDKVDGDYMGCGSVIDEAPIKKFTKSQIENISLGEFLFLHKNNPDAIAEMSTFLQYGSYSN